MFLSSLLLLFSAVCRGDTSSIWGVYAGIRLSPQQHQLSTRQWSVGQTVNTSSGLVQGHAASNLPDVSEYLGIPYAQPPVGRLRFQPPLKFTSTTSISGDIFVGCPMLTLAIEGTLLTCTGPFVFGFKHHGKRHSRSRSLGKYNHHSYSLTTPA
jgi:hypothetical protein